MFGISERMVARSELVDITITPRLTKVDVPEPRRAQNDRGSEGGSRSDPSKVSETLREYVPGDEPRRIHWRSSARLGQLVVRQELKARSETSLVVLDCRPTTWNTSPKFVDNNSDDNFELAVELLAGLVEALGRKDQEFRVYCNSRELLHHGASGPREYLHSLASLGMSQVFEPNPWAAAPLAKRLKSNQVIAITRGPDARKSALSLGRHVTVLEPDLTEVVE
jgi:uncharacterized protein (DUF58 family)